MSDAKIRVRQVGKTFVSERREVQALQSIDLDIQPNEFVTFVGASAASPPCCASSPAWRR